MAPPRRACVPPPSAEFHVRRLLVDGGSGLDRRYPFILIKSYPHKLKSTAEINLLCCGLTSRKHGHGLWDRGPIPWDIQ
jgi:hypothetical protein